jgi:hypothetical protein
MTAMTTNTSGQPDEMTAGEMLEDFTLSLVRIQFWLSAEQTANVQRMYTERRADNGDAVIVLHKEIRALLFSNRTRAHLDRMLGLVKDGITGIEALRAAVEGSDPPALVSGTL